LFRYFDLTNYSLLFSEKERKPLEFKNHNFLLINTAYGYKPQILDKSINFFTKKTVPNLPK